MPALPQIVKRVFTAFSKFGFCCRSAATPLSFWRLLVHTKKAKRSRNNPALYSNALQVAYTLQLHKHIRLFYLRTYQGDLQIFYDVFWRSIYQLPAPLFARAKTILDLGAHIGMTAAYFNIQCPQATIYCIEADEANYELLTNNLQPAIRNGKVKAIHAAISNSRETVYLQKASYSYNSQLSDAITPFPVKGIVLDQFIQEQHITHIDIIKIDIEGAESFLLHDPQHWMVITDTILIEIHSEQNLQLFKSAAARFGFRVEKRALDFENLYVAYKGTIDS
ncbi:FkbM family methyltransferase [Longitalea arenae]|uniref:FkbM family methyltransferase n=1 Tax=Longitalea arenae TaxID=2812558 RepID=UPI0019682741|nr:FkbM family methyltransferase [Longitalea arenae]